MNITHLNIKKEKQLLSAAQKAFNRLNNRIAKLKKDIEGVPRKMDVLRKYYMEKLYPLKEKQVVLRCETIKRLDYMYDTTKLGVRQRETLLEIIQEELEAVHDDLAPDNSRYEEMLSLHEKYMRETYSEGEIQEMEAGNLDMIKNMAKHMLGIDLDGIENLSKEEQAEFINKLMEEKMEERQAQEEKAREQHQKRQSKKKLTPRQEEKKQEADASLKTLREVYTDLVKKLHPDREKDETVRLEKTEQMKLITEAYEKKDLASLLLMQIQWLQHTEKDPMTQPDEVLARYNHVLKMHIEKLEAEYRELAWRPLPFNVGMDMYTVMTQDVRTFSAYLARQEKALKKEMTDAETFFAQIHSPDGLKQYIKEYKEEADWKEKNLMDFDLFDLFERDYLMENEPWR